MLQIYLARHGQDEDNAQDILNGHRDTPLTQRGIDQAKEIAQKIKAAGIKFDKVYSSPLQRAFQTAMIITNTIGIDKPIKLEEIIEREFGIMTGRFKSEIEPMCAPDIIKTDTIIYFLNPEGAETFPQLIERGKKIITKITNDCQDGKILLVTHGDIGKMIYAAYYNLDWQKVLTLFHFGNSDFLLLSPDSPATESHVFKIKQHNT